MVSVLLEACAAEASALERKTYGAVPASAWLVTAELERALQKLRVTAALRLGPPRANVTVAQLEQGSALLADALAADAAADSLSHFSTCDEEERVPSLASEPAAVYLASVSHNRRMGSDLYPAVF